MAKRETTTVTKDDIEELDLAELYGNNPSIQPVPTLDKAKAVSFNEPLVEGQNAKINNSTKRRFITRATIIDKFNTVKKRVELTPSVCDICAFDVAAKYFGSWHQTPPTERDKIVEALEQHKKLVHTKADNLIIDEEEMPTKWLGGGRL